jgi:hypothetical protein
MMNIAETSLYREFLAQKEEIMKHKWYESEKAGRDVGLAYALIDWTMRFKNKWVRERKKKKIDFPFKKT